MARLVSARFKDVSTITQCSCVRQVAGVGTGVGTTVRLSCRPVLCQRIRPADTAAELRTGSQRNGRLDSLWAECNKGGCTLRVYGWPNLPRVTLSSHLSHYMQQGLCGCVISLHEYMQILVTMVANGLIYKLKKERW